MAQKHILVLGDQLTRQVGPLAEADPDSTSVLMIESLELGHSLPHHKQKLIHVFSSMRHFAQGLEDDGFTVHYKRAEKSFESGIKTYMKQFKGPTLQMMEPNDYGYDAMLRKACEDSGGSLDIVPNGLWLSDGEHFRAWAEGRKELRMEYFYREMRTSYGYLMDEDGPEGGRWNYDKDNRETPEAGHSFPEVPAFEPDDITLKVIAFVKNEFANNFGDAEPFHWPVTREQALDALKDFCENRLRNFGPFEDALVQGEYHLYHSLLSPLINTGLLHPQEVIETAIDHFRDGRRKIPVNSIEGFVRQILGWREFMFRVYRYKAPEMREMNKLNHRRDLPEFYWTGETKMNCLHQCVKQLKETAHTHHIQRLMILGSFAQIAQINPQELLEWFTATYIDALEWVMVPNVIGMSQYADLGTFTSKPYAASANYINKMSNYCQRCHYNHRKKIGEDACPFNSLYWDFLNRHKDLFDDNPRMNMVVANWEKRDKGAKDEVLKQAERVKRKLGDGSL